MPQIPASKILVLTDGSPCANEAVRVAAGYAERLSASLDVAYFFDPVKYALPEGYVVYTPTQLVDMLAAFDAVVADAAARARQAGAPTVNARVLQGAIEHELPQLVEKEDIDLVVVGTHGRKGILHAVMGSVAEKVVRIAPCPVLSVKAPKE